MNDLSQARRAAEIQAIRGSEIASRIGWSYTEFTRAVAQGIIPPPWFESNGNQFWKKAEADLVIERFAKKMTP